jgi:hypothetical protein
VVDKKFESSRARSSYIARLVEQQYLADFVDLTDFVGKRIPRMVTKTDLVSVVGIGNLRDHHISDVGDDNVVC